MSNAIQRAIYVNLTEHEVDNLRDALRDSIAYNQELRRIRMMDESVGYLDVRIANQEVLLAKFEEIKSQMV